MKSLYKKGSKDYLIEQTDNTIGDLVHDKVHLFKAYNYYHGVRDKFLYENLEKNYGIGNPTTISFTPFIRKHIDALVGEYLSKEPKAEISCKDLRTLSCIMRDKQLEVAKKTHDYVRAKLDNAIIQAIFGQLLNQQQQLLKPLDPVVARELKEIEESIENNFISNYEKAGSTLVKYILQSRHIDLKNKLWDILRDLLIAGEAYFKISSSDSGENFELEVEDPINTFVERNTKSRYMKDGYRSVVRKWMSKSEIVIKYGNELSLQDIADLDEYDSGYNSDSLVFVEACAARGGGADYAGILQGMVSGLFTPSSLNTKFDLLPVYEVEWIDFLKKDNKLCGYRYETVRIGDDIYILRGIDQDLTRSMAAPLKPRLSINGMYYTDRTGAPYSLMLTTAELQDDYDLLNFYLKNTIALSGARGSIVDVAQLPEWLGASFEERLIKHLAYRKAGLYIIDSSLEGMTPNTIYNGFDETTNLQSILAIQLAIQLLELTASLITGVFQERLGGIEARDAVRNVEIGMLQSYVITNQYQQSMNTILREILLDGIDMAKKVFKDGMTGELIMGGEKTLFQMLPEYYTVTDFDVHIGDPTDILNQKDLLKLMALLLVGSNLIDPEELVIISTSLSLTEMRDKMIKSMLKKKEENNQIQQLSQQLEEALKQVKLMQTQLEQSTKKIQQLNERKLAIEQQNNQMQQQINWFKVKSDAENKEKELELIEKRNQLEALQLYDNNPNNDAINNNRY